ncbi:MAG: zinc-dependent peptidase [Bacteroidetes bacterium]|nr:zinc-dependent peptidase [Bacteroidota bacterium]
MAQNEDILLTVDELHGFYSNYFTYYNTLENPWRQLFRSRCIKFISDKAIIGAEGFKPNNKVKAIIAACAVQLTLGLKTWDLNYFETIILHPGDFENKASGLKYRGETNLAGFIRLSWKGFIWGYKVNDDNINLGLHEFTHALRFNAIKYSEQDYFAEHYFNKWQVATNEAYYDLKNNKETIFRKYGGANLNEFISVCIEHYFESPEEIKAKYPYLYYCTAILLNQQTQNGITRIDIREPLMNELNTLQKGFSQKTISTNLLRSTSHVVSALILVPLFFTVMQTGFSSGATIFLFVILFAIYLRFDLRFTKVQFIEKSFHLNKGFIFFKNWRKFSLPASHIVSLRVDADENNNYWEVIFYNPANETFYAETITSSDAIEPAFVQEVLKNKIAYFKS